MYSGYKGNKSRRCILDKRKIGAVVGVVGVTGVIATAQMIGIDRSTADHMTKDLTNQYKDIQDQAKKEDKVSDEVNVVEEKVFDSVQNVEYIVQKEEPIKKQKVVADLPSAESQPEEDQSASVNFALKTPQTSVYTAIEEKRPEEAPEIAKGSKEENPLNPLEDIKDEETTTPEVEIVVEKKKKMEERYEEEAREFRGIVTADVLNVRIGAGSNYEIVDILSKDDLVVGKIKDGWISFGEGDDLSYINAEYVDELTPAGFDQMIARQKTQREEAEARKKAEEEEAKKKAEEEAKKAAEKKAEEEKASEKESSEKKETKPETKEESQKESGAAYSGYVSVSTANVRKGPSNSAEIIGVVSINDAIQGEEVSLGWIKINYKGQTAFIHKNVLSFNKTKVEENKNQESKPKDSGKKVSGYVTADSLFVRQGPGMGYDQIGYLHRNDPVQGTDLNNGWIKIDYNGKAGYISSKFFSTEKQSTPKVEENTPSQNEDKGQVGQGTIDQIIRLAKQQLGKPYIYGAAGPNAFDCSGLTSWLYRSFGYTIQRRAAAQTSNGYAVSKKNLRPGDLVFFSNESSGGRVAHVGIYIGGGQIIHASTPQLGVRTDNLNSSWFVNHYKGARRIIN